MSRVDALDVRFRVAFRAGFVVVVCMVRAGRVSLPFVFFCGEVVTGWRGLWVDGLSVNAYGMMCSGAIFVSF